MNGLRSFIRFAVVVFLVSPILVVFVQVSEWQWPDFSELARVTSFTATQAFVSSVISLSLGVVGAMGLLAWRRPGTQMAIEGLLLLPSLMPSLFVIIACLNTVSVVMTFPFGFWGIVLIHSVVNAGLVSVVLAKIFSAKVGAMAELALVEGASRWQFLRATGLGYLRRDLGLVFLYVFSVCFTSFAIPLIVGGVQGTTLEVLIYEKLRLQTGWSQALSISAFQIMAVLLFSLGLSRQEVELVDRPARLDLLTLRWGIVVPLGLALAVVLGQFRGFSSGVTQLLQSAILLEILPRAMLGTLLVSFAVGLLTALLLLLIAFVVPRAWLQKFLLGYSAPSTVITGFALLVWGSYEPQWAFVKMVIGIALLCLPACYRLLGEATLNSIKGQVIVARTLGAGWWSVFREVVFPQSATSFFTIAGLAAFWASGDFALSSIVAGEDLTVALVARTMLSSYRIEQATALVWLMLVCGGLVWLFFGGLVWLFFGGLGRVVGRKLSS